MYFSRCQKSVFDASHLRQIDKHHLVSRKSFFSMQEITLYFLRQSRLHFMLIWNSKPLKWQVETDNKNCNSVLSLESYFLYLWLLKLSYCFLYLTLILFFFFRRNFFISCSSVTWGSITPPLQHGLQFSSAFFFLCCPSRDLVLFIMVSINSLLQGSLNSFNKFRYERKKEKKYRLNSSTMWR